MLSVLASGGILMIPLGICAVIATFIICERLFYYRKIQKKDFILKEKIHPLVESHRFEEAVQLCNDTDTPLSQVVKKAIECKTWPEDNIKEVVSIEIDKVIPNLEHFLTSLGTIASISTLLGLLGTVTGNIQAFGVLGGGDSMGNPAVFAGAIAEALVTTATGLVISIPTIIFHNYFLSRINRRISEIESVSTAVVLHICGRKPVGFKL